MAGVRQQLNKPPPFLESGAVASMTSAWKGIGPLQGLYTSMHTKHAAQGLQGNAE